MLAPLIYFMLALYDMQAYTVKMFLMLAENVVAMTISLDFLGA
jgi:hypothetical protein